MENSNGGDTNVGSIGNSIKNERSSIEETIKIIERKIKEAEHYTDITGLYLTLDKELYNAFINILSDYKKLQEEFRQVDHECDRLEKIDFEKDMKIKELQQEIEELEWKENQQKVLLKYETDKIQLLEKEIEGLKNDNKYLRERETYLEKRREDIINLFQNQETATTIPKSKLKDIIDRIDYDIKKTKEIISKKYKYLCKLSKK